MDGVGELQCEGGFEIGAALGSDAAAPAAARTEATPPTGARSAAGATEQVAEQVADVGPAHVEPVRARPAGATRAGEPAGHRPQGPDLVVLLAFGLVAQDVVGGGDVLEPFLGGRVPGIGIGVELTGQLAVGLGDVLRRGALGHAEHLVVVLLEPLTLCGHQSPSRSVSAWGPHPLTLTMAGRRTLPFQR